MGINRRVLIETDHYSFNMGSKQSSSGGYTPLIDKKEKEKNEKSSIWKEYKNYYSINSNNVPKKDGYKKL